MLVQVKLDITELNGQIDVSADIPAAERIYDWIWYTASSSAIYAKCCYYYLVLRQQPLFFLRTTFDTRSSHAAFQIMYPFGYTLN
jgi:hypothetical protein